MQPENFNQETEQANQVTQASRLHQVTPLSKNLTMALFVILPFVGGWIGYTYAPEKVVEVVREVEVEKQNSIDTNEQESVTANGGLFEPSEGQIYRNDEYGFAFQYPVSWEVATQLDDGTGYVPIVQIYNSNNPAIPNSDSGGDSFSVSLIADSEIQRAEYQHACSALVSDVENATLVELFGWDEHDGIGDARSLCVKLDQDVFNIFMRSDNLESTVGLQATMDAITDSFTVLE